MWELSFELIAPANVMDCSSQRANLFSPSAILC